MGIQTVNLYQAGVEVAVVLVIIAALLNADNIIDKEGQQKAECWGYFSPPRNPFTSGTATVISTVTTFATATAISPLLLLFLLLLLQLQASQSLTLGLLLSTISAAATSAANDVYIGIAMAK